MDIDQALALRRLLYANGYQPVEVKTGEKVPVRFAWQTKVGVSPPRADALNTGIACKGLCPLDIDVDDASAVERIIAIVHAVAGHTELIRTRADSAHCMLLYRAPDGTEPKKRVIKLGDLGKIEILGNGQQFVAYGIHPEGAEFEWLDSGPDVVKRDDAPVLTPEHEAEIRRRLYEEFSIEPEPAPQAAPPNQPVAPSPTGSIPDGAGGSDFFTHIKDEALRRLGEWVPIAFPKATFQPGTGAWSISSRDLGRNLQERLSFHPEGVQDFGTEQASSPISALIDHGIVTDALAGARWFCDRLALDYDALWAETHPVESNEELREFFKYLKPKLVAVDGQRVDTGGDLPVIASKPATQRKRDNYAEEILKWDGLVPDIARYILSCARKPQPAFAVMAALAVVATVSSRQMVTPEDGNLSLFITLITRQSNGKEAPMRLAPQVLRWSGFQDLVSPNSGFASDIGVYRWLHSHPVTMNPFDEFGDHLAALTAKNGAHLAKILPLFRKLYDGDQVDSPHAGQRDSLTIIRPCMTILAASTPGQFFDAIGSKHVEDGTLVRFLAVYVPERVTRAKYRSMEQVDISVRERLKALAHRSGGLNFTRFYAYMGDIDPGAPYRLPWGAGAKDAWDAYELSIEDRMDREKAVDALGGRSAQNALRLASILAISENIENPVVELRHVEMGVRIANQSLSDMINGMQDHLPESRTAPLMDKLLARIRERGPVSKRDLLRSMSRAFNNVKELDELLSALKQAGSIVEEPAIPDGGGTPTLYYSRAKDAAEGPARGLIHRCGQARWSAQFGTNERYQKLLTIVF